MSDSIHEYDPNGIDKSRSYEPVAARQIAKAFSKLWRYMSRIPIGT